MPEIPNALNSLYQQAEAAVASLLSQTHFLFTVADQPKDTFKIIHWQGSEKISSSYRYTLSLAARGVVDEAKILGKDATLSIAQDVNINQHGEMRVIHGYVGEINYIGPLVSDHAEEYQVVIASPIAKLNLTRQCRVFLNFDLKSVIEQVLLTAGFPATSFQIDLKSAYPVREYIAQYNETDFNFFSRLLEHAGVFYSFVQQDEQALLVIQDDSAALPQMAGTGSLLYVPASGQVEIEESVQLLQKELHYLPESVKRKDYNYRTPESTLIGEAMSGSKIPATGTDYTYGEHAPSLEEIEQLARRRQEMYDSQRENYIAETNCRGMVSGTTFSIHGHPQEYYNGDYLVVSVLHQGDQSHGFAFGGARSLAATGKTYHNELSLIKKDTPYRAPVDHTRRPQVSGVLTAKIETTGGDYAYLDDQGRYRLKSMFDTVDTKAGEASHPVRMLQHLAGANYGMHFPLHAGTEVLVTCLNGDPDRPIILGSVTNPASISPVTSANASQHIIRTAAGNELLMDDMADSEKINLHTKDQKNILTLDANNEGHRLALRTEEGLAEFYAKKTIRFESGDTYTLITGNNQTITVENKHSLQTNKKEIAFDAATDILLNAKHNIKLNTEEKDISLASGQDLIIEAGKGMAVRVMDGDNSYTIQQGSVSIDAANAITILSQDGPITIQQGTGKIELSDGKLSVMAPSVSIEGDSVAIKGQMAEMSGGGSAAAAASKTMVAASTKAAPATSSSSSAAAQAPVATAPVATATKAAASTPLVEAAKKKEEDKGRFITAAEGQKIADVAKLWSGTPYAPRYILKILVPGSLKYAGGKPVKKKGADCSGSVWAIYKEAGFSYGSYHDTATFPDLVSTDANFVKGKHYFKKVDAPQVGDVGWWNGHMVIYDPAIAQDNFLRNKYQAPGTKSVWSASNSHSPREFAPAWSHWYDDGKPPKWYRYFKAAP